MKKRWISTVLTLLMASSLIVVDCVSAEPKYKLRIAGPLPGEWDQMKDMDRAAERIYQRTNGAVEIKSFWDGVLGAYEDMLATVSEGSLDLLWGIVGADYDKRANVMYVPYQVTNYRQVWAMEKNPDGFWWRTYEKIFDDLDIKLLAFSDMGFFAITNNRRPVRTLADCKGLKIRRMRIQSEALTCDSWGMSSTSMDFGELMVGLKTGVMDGQTNGARVTYLYLRDLTKYFSDTRQFFETGQVVMSKKTWNKLPEMYRTIIQEEYLTHMRDQHAKAEADEVFYMGEMEKYGIKVVRFSDEELRPFIEAARGTWPQCENLIGKPLMDELRGAVAAVSAMK